MPTIPNVFIVEPINQGWIIERLMRDVASELDTRGVPTRIGPASAYAGEAVIFNSRFLTPLSDSRARVNSLFITHVDDRLKEMELQASFKRFNSLVCISSQDADFVAELQGSRQGVVGIDLPARDLSVRPQRIALFSAHYQDGRKNEAWILDYCRARPREVRDAFVFCFLGGDWERYSVDLAALDLNFEIVRFARSLHGEYEFYKQKLATMDVLIYPGFDGGAMSVYDGLSAGIEVLASDVSYHRGLGDSVKLFEDRPAFYRQIDRLYAMHHSRLEALRQRSISAYVDHLITHWCGLLGTDGALAMSCTAPAEVDSQQQALALYRSRYKPLSLTRLRSALIRALQARLLR